MHCNLDKQGPIDLIDKSDSGFWIGEHERVNSHDAKKL